MGKKMKKKIKIRWGSLFLVFIFAVCLFFLYYALMVFPISNIYIEGNSILSDLEIMELGKIEDYPSFVKTTSKMICEGIKESPYITSCKVKKSLGGQVYVFIEEARPLFLNTEGKLVLSNEKEIQNDRNLIVASLLNEIPNSEYEELIEKLSKLDISIFREISEIEYSPKEKYEDRFAFYMNDGNLVYAILTKFSRMDYYLEAVKQVTCQKGIFNFDSGNHFQIKENLCD